MQNVNLDNAKVRGKGIILIKGSFLPNGSSTPATSGFLGGHIKTVVWTSTGIWTVTLRDRMIRAVESFWVGLQLNASADSNIHIGAFSNLGTNTDATFPIRVLTGGSLADVASNANNRISFLLVCRQSVLK